MYSIRGVLRAKFDLLLGFRHALPLFTSLLNIIFSYDPVGYGLPYNYLMFTDSREMLVEIACQLLCVVLETNISITKDGNNEDQVVEERNFEGSSRGNLFISYISRIHREDPSTPDKTAALRHPA